jgi:uncharacterized protein
MIRGVRYCWRGIEIKYIRAWEARGKLAAAMVRVRSKSAILLFLNRLSIQADSYSLTSSIKLGKNGIRGSTMNIIDILRRRDGEIKERFHVKRIGLFGSFARGDEKETSDVDIMVEFEQPTFDNFMKLAFFLEDLLGKNVELVTPDSLSPYIAPYAKDEVVWADQA